MWQVNNRKLAFLQFFTAIYTVQRPNCHHVPPIFAWWPRVFMFSLVRARILQSLRLRVIHLVGLRAEYRSSNVIIFCFRIFEEKNILRMGSLRISCAT
ncbi:hypothetical protein Y032_0110g148 [Ancylostoma ceylanicum]|uniref:Uncharacterized protein n=1 Tax=Ancylostoma ceylanicum TaxID=53326 RepID=A0A016TEI7_9BILA|nr:hypothetical protein Y032_0110g148 [Ancylostoma ceylanicum]